MLTTLTYYDEIKLKKQQNESMTKMRGSKKVVASVRRRLLEKEKDD